MYKKNKEQYPKLGQRLLDLMIEQSYDTPRELAKVLYDQNLVHVKPRVKDNPDYDARISAIGSIEKKIGTHITKGVFKDDSGEYLAAYSKVLHCSTDYLLGLTPIRSDDLEIRRICEKTGLAETVVERFISMNKEGTEFIAGWWNYILSQPMFYHIPNDLVIASMHLQKQYDLDSVFRTIEWQIQHCPQNQPNTILALREQYQYYNEELANIQPSFQGLLFKISRDLTSTVEEHIKEINEPEHKRSIEENLQFAREKAKEGIYYTYDD